MEATTFVDLRGASAPRAARTASLNLIWADKVGIYMAALGLVFMAYLWSMAAMAAGVSGANHIMQHEIRDALACDLAIAASFWLFFRAADWAVGGPRRRARRRAR
jgi:hypothetical protein